MIDWIKIKLKRDSGQEKTTCPNCSETSSKPKDPCLSVNHGAGVAKCHRCDDISIRDLKPKKAFTLPNQEWTNHTQLSDGMVKWFKGRGIGQQTLIDCKITEEEHYQPSKGKSVVNTVFNYFEGQTLVNKKYRSADKCFSQEKDAKKIFYGLNDVIAEDECYIVEGEMDKLALWEIGVKNCISVPNGAKDVEVFENCEEFIKSIKKFYIAVDMDAAGKELELELIKRLGKHRSYRIHFKGKDANEDLISGVHVLEESLNNPIQYPIDGTFTASDIKEEIFNLYDNGFDETIKVKNEAFGQFNNTFSFVKGQLTVVTGIPSHGKSNFIEWYLLNLVNDQNLKISFYSPEHFPMEQHQRILAEKMIGKKFMGEGRMSKGELAQYIEWSKDKIYLTMPEKAIIPSWDWLFQKFEEQLFRYGIDLFVIDAFNKVKLSNGTLFELSDILARLTLFCQMHHVNIFVIAHPTKMKKEDGTDKYIMPTLYDVKGTGDFYDQTHNGLTVYRTFGEDSYTKVVSTKLKFRHQGEAGQETAFRFDKDNGRFYHYNGHPSSESLIKEETKAMFNVNNSVNN